MIGSFAAVVRRYEKALMRPFAPVVSGFLASVFLSLIAVWNNPVLNRDGMLYVTLARDFIGWGFAIPTEFDWSFYPVLIAGVGWVTGLDPEFVAHALNTLFMAGTCALMIDLARRRVPGLAWTTCLVVLAMPAYNGYRDFIIREFGYWFFCTLAFWFALCWEDRGYRWREAVASQLALVGAVLFRLEAIVFFPALLLWQVVAAPAGLKAHRGFKIACLPLFAGAVLLALLISGKIGVPARVEGYLAAASFFQIDGAFRRATAGLAPYLPVFSRSEAGFVLLTGLLAFIPVKFVGMLGVFMVPAGYRAVRHPSGREAGNWSLLLWAMGFYAVALAAFIGYQLFISARYVSTLNLLAVPLVAAAYGAFTTRHPKAGKTVAALALVTMLANVVSFSPGKGHVREAGQWLGQNAAGPDKVYVQDSIIAFYAGWPYRHGVSDAFDPIRLQGALAAEEFRWLVLVQPRRDPSVSEWLKANPRLQVVRQFANSAGERISVVAWSGKSGE